MARRSLVLAVILFARMAWAVCGDGVPDPGEDCDDGNLTGGDCCSPTCTFEAAGSPCPDDGNRCSLDECDANGTCTHPTGGQASCDDGDPCTADDVCDAGVCAGTFVLEGCIDTVQCRRSRRESGFDSIPVGMDDQFAPALLFGTAGRPHDLCLPASTTGTPPLDPDAALVNLKLRVKGAFRSGTWHVTDRFGEIDVETRRPDRLLVATATDASGPPAGPPPPGSANQYACRKVRSGRTSDAGSCSPSTMRSGARSVSC